MKKAIFLCAVWMTGAATMALPVSAKPHTPKVGSSERTALMNSLRRVLGTGKHKPIITPSHLRVEKGWAYISGGFNYSDGAPLEEEFSEGSGSNFSALLRLEKGKWKVKRRLYHGDVVAPDFMRDFPAAPRAIFLEN
ncbi:hypothetical protein EON83_18885 [bacterium]|nr:MAG: hypothetical protein EON83_18885 [bacterium]